MKKYFFNDKEVKIGDKIACTMNVEVGKTIIPTILEVVLDEANSVDLIDKGIINCVISAEDSLTDAVGLAIYSAKLLSYDAAEELKSFSKGVYFQLLLRITAKYLDSQYPDHISNSTEIWCIDSLSGRPAPVNKENIKSYETFAAFRSREDAGRACTILKQLKKELFNGE